MSKMQGDSYVTWTNEDLNKHISKVTAELIKLADEKTKVFDFKDGVSIVCTQENIVTHVDWKWNSIKVIGKRYYIYLYQDYKAPTSEVLKHKVIDNDSESANRTFLEFKQIAETC